MPNTSPNAYDVESVTAAAPMIEALSSTSANRSPASGLMVCDNPAATDPPSVKCPAIDVCRESESGDDDQHRGADNNNHSARWPCRPARIPSIEE